MSEPHPGAAHGGDSPADSVRLLLVRHGQTLWNAEGRLQGQLDSPLTSEGVAQARSLARSLRGTHLDRVVASDLPRARHTAELLLEARGSAPSLELEESLRERHFGFLQGLVLEALDDEQRHHYDQSRRDPHYCVPGGESRAQVLERALRGLEHIAQSSGTGRSVLVVTHGGVLSVVLRALQGVPLHGPRSFVVGNCSLYCVQYRGGALTLLAGGQSGHHGLERPEGQ